MLLVDRPSKYTSTQRNATTPSGGAHSTTGPKEEVDSILQLLKARLDLPDLNQSSPGSERDSSRFKEGLARSGAFLQQREMTPTPMVVGQSLAAARAVDSE